MKSMLEFANEHSFLFLIGILCGTIIASTIVSVLKELLLKLMTYPLNMMQWSNIHKHGWPPVCSSNPVQILEDSIEDDDETSPKKREYHA
jgi:hypothetical protein